MWNVPALRRRRRSGDAVEFLRSNLSGGDAALFAYYVYGKNMASSGGGVDTLDDARGPGFGPQLVGTGHKPPDETANGQIGFDGTANQYLISAIVPGFRISAAAPKSIFFIGSVHAGTNNLRLAGIEGEFAGSFLRIGDFGNIVSRAPGVITSSTVASSVTRRLAVAFGTEADTDIQVPNVARQEGAGGGGGAVAEDNRIQIGGSVDVGKMWAFGVILREFTAADVEVLKTLATTFGGATLA
jgi:hypothetical protein